MKRISSERKTAVLVKLLPPYNITVAAVAQWTEYPKLLSITGETRLNQRGNRCLVQIKIQNNGQRKPALPLSWKPPHSESTSPKMK